MVRTHHLVAAKGLYISCSLWHCEPMLDLHGPMPGESGSF